MGWGTKSAKKYQNRREKMFGFKIGGSKLQILQNRGTKTAINPKE
jgi:hypothetical protein